MYEFLKYDRQFFENFHFLTQMGLPKPEKWLKNDQNWILDPHILEKNQNFQKLAIIM